MNGLSNSEKFDKYLWGCTIRLVSNTERTFYTHWILNLNIQGTYCSFKMLMVSRISRTTEKKLFPIYFSGEISRDTIFIPEK